MLVTGPHVELLATVETVAVANEAELLQHVERAIDGRRRGRRVVRAASFDQLGGADVTRRGRQGVDDGATLARPPQAAMPEVIRHVAPANDARRGRTASGR